MCLIVSFLKKSTVKLGMKIKPSVLIGGQPVYYPGYFTIDQEFRSGAETGGN